MSEGEERGCGQPTPQLRLLAIHELDRARILSRLQPKHDDEAQLKGLINPWPRMMSERTLSDLTHHPVAGLSILWDPEARLIIP